MSNRPRRLLRLVICATLGALPVSTSAALPSGVAAGDVNQQSAVLWAAAGAAGTVNFEYSTDAGFGTVVGSQAVTVSDPLVPAKWDLSSLTAGTRYYYRATDGTAATAAGTFVTPAALGTQAGFHMGVTGDWRGEVGPYSGIRNIASRNLDLLVKLGDTIYADVASAANGGQSQAQTLTEFRNKHLEVQTPIGGQNYWQAANQSTAIIAMIDDHEVTNDFAGFNTVSNDSRFTYGGAAPTDRLNKTPLFNNGVQAFHDWMPIRTETYANTGVDPRMDGLSNLYRARRYGKDAAVITVDARTFRDTELAPINPTQLNNPVAVQAYIASTFTPGRTLLGNRQFSQLAGDLLAAQQAGTTWKFINLPEPIQNLGVLAAEDRYEGYAAERTALLAFIDGNNPTGRPIDNVVFVSADIHGTLVNNLTYFNGTTQKKVKSFEITTGSVGYDAPFGPTIAGTAAALGLAGSIPLSTYLALPASTQETYIKAIIDSSVTPLGYSPLGLEDSGLNYQVLAGATPWTATNSYGWTEFTVDPVTQLLTVTTWGVPWYPAGTSAAYINSLTPQILSSFSVTPVPEPTLAVVALGGLSLVLRRKARDR